MFRFKSISLQLLLLLPLVVLCTHICVFRTNAQEAGNGAGAQRGDNPEPGYPLGHSAEEMRAKQMRKQEIKEHQQNLERAKDAERIADDLSNLFAARSTLSKDDVRKLEQLEKLTKQLRSHAGGSDGELDIAVPTDPGTAFKQLVKLVKGLRKEVDATPRQVISAVIIERANDVLEVVRVLRGFFH